ncbi:hypothetical protein [Geobacillus stearothermophilus]|uniref:hypothetical protein n=2 Tax=Anoxybacillaceae TaxID=3120669 RepID=UPI001F2A78FB|nr:hypothetical protein [Geobacillus stearothermophilus]MED3724480.1 hypothetical protein [Geobacillus stearothermophilus]MED3749227.1 hypothetical protein [Geobacillus stearothermophilus]MED3754610.1 hypothetical protein [Geobacillus stearothermophilus]MED3843376.1 hypothetical protein [Geobacillus stearothermophilus]MED4356607.1 hypothetical protein [Geobacillus stearothermophilus]
MDWFVRTMKRTFNVAANIDEVGYEAYEFYHEELDNYLVPEEHLEKLPNPLLFETLRYVDEKRNDWIAGFVRDEETGEKLYEVWIKNGEPIAYEIYV